MTTTVKAKNKDKPKRLPKTLWDDINDWPSIFSIDVSILQDQSNKICFGCKNKKNKFIQEPNPENKKPSNYYEYWFVLPIGTNVKYFHLQCYIKVRKCFGQIDKHHLVPWSTKQLKGFKSIPSVKIKKYVRRLLWPMQVPYKDKFQQKLPQSIIHMTQEELRIELEKRNLCQFVLCPEPITITKKYKERINKFLNQTQCKQKGHYLVHGYCREIETDYPVLIIPYYLKCLISQRFDWSVSCCKLCVKLVGK